VADTVTAPVATQTWERSDCSFRAAVSDDLVFAGTHYACNTTTANRVHAIQASNANVRWTFNATATYQVDAVTGLVADASRNRVFAVTHKSDPARVQPTVWALDSTSGVKLWSVDKGAIHAAPILGEALYVLATTGELHKLDPVNGATIWSLTLAGDTRTFEHMAYDPTRGLLFAADSIGDVHGIADQGASAASLWTRSASFYASQGVVVTPSRGWVYASTSDSKVHQIDELSGIIDRTHTLWPPQGGGHAVHAGRQHDRRGLRRIAPDGLTRRPVAARAPPLDGPRRQ
jgi:outer membrane protein assembly factor BamB